MRGYGRNGCFSPMLTTVLVGVHTPTVGRRSAGILAGTDMSSSVLFRFKTDLFVAGQLVLAVAFAEVGKRHFV